MSCCLDLFRTSTTVTASLSLSSTCLRWKASITCWIFWTAALRQHLQLPESEFRFSVESVPGAVQWYSKPGENIPSISAIKQLTASPMSSHGFSKFLPYYYIYNYIYIYTVLFFCCFRGSHAVGVARSLVAWP